MDKLEYNVGDVVKINNLEIFYLRKKLNENSFSGTLYQFEIPWGQLGKAPGITCTFGDVIGLEKMSKEKYKKEQEKILFSNSFN